MNGKFVNDQTNLERSQFLAAIADAPFMDADGKVEALFLRTEPIADAERGRALRQLRPARRHEQRQQESPDRRVLGAAEFERVYFESLGVVAADVAE